MTDPLRIIDREEHGIDRCQVSANACKVTEQLQAAGYHAFIVGGGVRDLLLDQAPKDFDVATDATPDEVVKVFRRARLIGRRFRIVHVRFGREVIEVATFRSEPRPEQRDHDRGRLLTDNVFGTEAEDARRRDFTINALMYDPSTETVRDHVDGYRDVVERRLRLIGHPVTRYREDPVRLLRAVRFLVKLDLSLEPDTAGPIVGMAPLLANIPPARLFDETLKLFLGGHAWETFQALVRFRLWEQLFPAAMADPDDPPPLVRQALINTDARVAENKPVTPGFLFAALLWPQVQTLARQLIADGVPPVDALGRAGEAALSEQARHVAIPRRFGAMSKEIWCFQPRFERRRGKRVLRLMRERRFRAAYDFLLLRAAEQPELAELAEWWTRIQEVDEAQRQRMIHGKGKGRGKDKRREGQSDVRAGARA